MKRFLCFLVFFCVLILPFSSYAASSDMVDLSSYLVNFNEEITWEYTNVECPLRERTEINMVNLALTRPITINNYSAVYTVDFPRSTVQYSNVTDLSVQVMGRIYITGLLQLDTPSGYEVIYSDTKALSVSNNNQIGEVPRWTYNGDPITFVFDLSGYDNCDIIRFQIQFEFYNARSDNTRYTFYVRHQITDFYAAPYDIADLGDQITGAINDQTTTIVDSIQQDPGDLPGVDFSDIFGDQKEQLDQAALNSGAQSFEASYNTLATQSTNVFGEINNLLRFCFIETSSDYLKFISWGTLICSLIAIIIAHFQRKA